MDKRMPWFKWWDGTTEDLKFRMLADEENIPVGVFIAVWAHLLERASRNPERGTVEDMNARRIAYTLQFAAEQVETVCNALKRDGLVTETGEIVKWEERQAKREKSEPAGASTKRVQALRERQKAMKNKGLEDGNGGNGDETDETEGTDGNAPKKKRKKESKPKPSSSSGDDGFAKFWEAYPHRVGKIAARKAWAKAKVDAELLATILAAIEAQKTGDQWMREAGQYIPHPASWLNGGRWLDEVRPFVPQERRGADRWWETREAMIAKGLTLTPPLKPNPGEYPHEFRRRIDAALEQGDRSPPPAQPTPYTPPMPRDGEDSLTPEQREARRLEAREHLAKAIAISKGRPAPDAQPPESQP